MPVEENSSQELSQEPARAWPARAWEAPQILNGDYLVPSPDLPDILRFQIYTVTRGVLVGLRIVKIPMDGYQNPRGFAFLTAGGSLKIWRRYEGNEEMRAIEQRIARLLSADAQVTPFRTACAVCNVETSDGVSFCHDHRDTRAGTENVRNGRIRGTEDCPENILMCENGTGEIR